MRVGANLPAPVRAFDAAAGRFDERFGHWQSVAAQRRAVREYLLNVFPSNASLLELGAGTGEDALCLLARGNRIVVTDGAPAMVARAAAKMRGAGYHERAAVEQLVLEDVGVFAARRRAASAAPFDGVYSNFGALNCLADPTLLAAPLAALVRPRAPCVFVVFGPFSPGELVLQLFRGDLRAAVRRLRRGAVPAAIGGLEFTVWYRTPAAWTRAFAPWFHIRHVRGIGILVPPSAAEPGISRFPSLIRALEAADRWLAAPLALLGDQVLLHFERTDHPAP